MRRRICLGVAWASGVSGASGAWKFTYAFCFPITAVQNERQPRNTATIRPETLREMEHGRALREAAVAVGVFG